MRRIQAGGPVFFVERNENKALLILREIKGAAENPELVMEIKDTGERVTSAREAVCADQYFRGRPEVEGGQ